MNQDTKAHSWDLYLKDLSAEIETKLFFMPAIQADIWLRKNFPDTYKLLEGSVMP